ncbi:MAG: hypothetical protein FJZ47_23370 [Candidatus Tectomicrobia bacterium]|uniref:OmpR/PhoB-type domain-containing protein n=1 Tax=Tectimicrobiota bacterium TaxID=2528274 RepID=A0A937W6N2_UNCTE|nr:hypothetical protein [Candidatus Tectomicrobia bacterium]
MQYHFGAYVLDMQCYELRHHGAPIRLEPQIFQALIYLLQHRDQAVTREELFAALWPEQFVSEAALERCIAVVRRALGDNGHEQRFIKTLRGYGYRFIAAVEEHTAALPDAPLLMEPPDLTAIAPEPEPTPVDVAEVWPPAAPFIAARKAATVLCGSLAHVTALAEQWGLDRLYEDVQAFMGLAQQVVQQYGGTFQPFGHEGFLALFGAPKAQENHAQCAVLAALALQQRLYTSQTLAERAAGLAQALRLGLHTGQVLVGEETETAATPPFVLGDTTKLAAHLQYVAEPGTVLASEATIRLVAAEVCSVACGDLTMPGESVAMPLYRVLERHSQRAFVALQTGYTVGPLVGRAQEMALLHACLHQVETGAGQVVHLVGEAGIGKSRLVYEFLNSPQASAATCIATRCTAYNRMIPYVPILDVLQYACGITETDTPASMGSKICQALDQLGMVAAYEAPYLLQLLGVPADAVLLTPLPPEAIQTRTFVLLRQMCLYMSRRQPFVMVVEDAQWMDTTSEAFLTTLVEDLAGAPILLLMTLVD